MENSNDFANGWGNNGMFGMEWIFALLILPMLWGGNGGLFGRGGGENPVTESALCNSQNFQNLQNAVGRISDQMQANQQQTTNGICEASYENLRNIMGLQQTVFQGDTATQALIAAGDNATQRQIADCCCQQLRAADSINFNAAMNTAAINANTTEKIQKVLDVLCGNRMADMQNQINALQLQAALGNVVRYPNATTFSAGFNPFFNAGFCCNGNGNGNI